MTEKAEHKETGGSGSGYVESSGGSSLSHGF